MSQQFAIEGARAALLRDAAERAIRYLDGLDGRSGGVSPEAIARLALLREPLPDAPRDAAEVLALLDEIGSAATTATAGGRFFGYVIGGSLPGRWRRTGWRGRGIRTPGWPPSARSTPDWRRLRSAGCGICSGCPVTAAARS